MDNLENLKLKLNYHVMKKCNEKWKISFQKLQFNDLTFVLNGEAIYFVDGVKYELNKGDAMYIPKNSTRMAYTNPQNPMVCVAFNFDMENNLNIPTSFKWEKIHKLMEYFKEINYEWLHENLYYDYKCQLLLKLIIVEILSMENDNQYNNHVAYIKDYIFANLSKKITVKQIADNLNLHPAYCGAIFKKHTNTTIIKYIQNMRISKAKNLLLSNDLSVAEIGEQVGLGDPYYFSKSFKSVVGISPLEFRKINSRY